MPEDGPDGWAFLRAHGFEPTGEMADLLANIARFRAPEWVLGRAGGGVRFVRATPTAFLHGIEQSGEGEPGEM